MAKSLQMNFASVMTFHDNGKPQSLTKYDSGNDNSDSDSAIKHSLELEKVNVQHRVANNSAELEEGGMKLSEAIEAYKDWKQKDTRKGKAKGLSDKAAKARYTNFEILLLALGDKDIEAISGADILLVISIIENMPRRNIKPYCDNKDLAVWISAAKNREIPEEDLVSSKLVKEAFKAYQSLFSTFLTKTKFLLKSAPTAGLKVNFESQSYACFSNKQMKDIVNFWAKKEDSDYKWIVLLGAYTGARRGDVFNLKLSSVRFDTTCNRHYLFVEGGKTKAARRKIPIHNHLIKMGFLDFVKSVSTNQDLERKLFRTFTTSHYITDKFRSCLDTLSIPNVNDELRRFSFHSLRHAVITEMASCNDYPLFQRVVGHEITKLGISKVYAGEFKLKKYLPVIDCLDWQFKAVN